MEKEIKRGRKKKEIDGDFAKLLSKLLQEVKTKNGIIQDDVAKSIGVSRQALGKWANGETVPDILDLKKLAKYFNVSTDYLLGLTNNKTTNTEIQSICKFTGLNEEAVRTLNVELSYTKLGYITLPLDGKEIPINITLAMAELANRFITGDYFIALLQTVIYLKKNSVEWVEECKNGIKSKGGNFCGNEKTRILSKECDFAILDCNRIIEDFVRKYDNRYNKPEFEQRTEHRAINYMKDEILAKMEEEQNGKHNPPKE